MWSYWAIQPSWSTEIASEDNTYQNLWILWRHVKIKKCKSCIISHIPWLKCLIFLCFWVELCKTLDNDGQEIKISTRMNKFLLDFSPRITLGTFSILLHYRVKYAVFIKNENEFSTKIWFWMKLKVVSWELCLFMVSMHLICIWS